MKIKNIIVILVLISQIGCKKSSEAESTTKTDKQTGNPYLPANNPIAAYKLFIEKVKGGQYKVDESILNAPARTTSEIRNNKNQMSKLLDIDLIHVSLMGAWEKEDGKHFISVMFKVGNDGGKLILLPDVYNNQYYQMIHAENKFQAIVEYRDASAPYPEGFYVKHLQTSKEEKLNDRVHCYEKKNLQFLDSSWRGPEKKCVKEIDILAYTDMSVEYPPTIEIDLRDNSIIRATD